MIQTQRLLIRPWREEDLEPFALLNADSRVMEYFPATLSKMESDDLARRFVAKIEEKGWGLWVASLIDTEEFIGFIGLNDLTPSTFPAPFTPAVEIGWRLSFDFWNKGYATEGAKAARNFAFEILDLKEIVSFTAVQNQRSRRVMEKIGMTHDPRDDFDHPKLPKEHRLSRHVLYHLGVGEWQRLK
jgi:3-dehydroquinate dehydratase/shikimate dehydrogenase